MWRSTVRPSEDTPNGGTHVLAVYAPLGQLDYFVALALQQHGEQSALRKGRGHNVVSFCFLAQSQRMDNFRSDSVHSCGRFLINLGGLSRERAIPQDSECFCVDGT